MSEPVPLKVVHRLEPSTRATVIESVDRLRRVVLSAGVAVTLNMPEGDLNFVDIHNVLLAATEYLDSGQPAAPSEVPVKENGRKPPVENSGPVTIS